MDQMMHGKLVMDNWAREVRLEGPGGSQQQEEPAGRWRKLSQWVHSILRQAGHGLSSVGAWLKQHGEPRAIAHAGDVGQKG